MVAGRSLSCHLLELVSVELEPQSRSQVWYAESTSWVLPLLLLGEQRLTTMQLSGEL